IGEKTRTVVPADASNHICGVTAGNDVSERDWQKNDLQWFRAKGCDTFGVLGPSIVTGLDYNNLSVESRVNGEIRQSGRTSELIFPVDTIISYISQFVTLMPGDVIYTGTPGTTKPMHPAEVIEIEVEGVGVLRNPANDRFVLSKGHAAPLLWAAYAEAGIIDENDVLTLRQLDSNLEGHPTPRMPWVDVATGSLGQGLSVGLGNVLAAHMDDIP